MNSESQFPGEFPTDELRPYLDSENSYRPTSPEFSSRENGENWESSRSDDDNWITQHESEEYEMLSYYPNVRSPPTSNDDDD